MIGHEKRDDDLVDHYLQASALDTRRPAERVGEAVRAHARMVAAAGTREPAGVSVDRPATNAPRWKLAMVASFAVFGLAGLLFLQLDRGPAQERELAIGPAAPTLPAPASVASRSETVAPQLPSADARIDVPPQAESALAKSSQSPAKPAVKRGAARPSAPAPVPAIRPSVAVAEDQAAKADTATASIASTSSTAPAAPAAPAALDPVPATLADAGAGIAEGSRPLARAVPAMPGASTQRLRQATPAGGSLQPPLAGVAPRAASAAAAPADTALHALARTGRVAALATILDAGVLVDARDASGRTALMLAAMAGHAEMVQRLLAAGAKPDLRDHDQLTAAQLARARGFEAIARTIEAGS